MQSQQVKPKKHRWRANLFLSLGIVVILLVGMTALSTQNYLWRIPASHSNSHPRALVTDQLSLNYPDPSFSTSMTNALNAAGYAVDYFGPTPTAVDSLRQLPSQGYDLIIIRAHTGSSQSIITSEPYSKSPNLFVGWDSSVSIIHTDTSTVALVQLLSAGKSLPEATAQAGGADPVYGARLQYLDWNALIQSRVSSLVSTLVVWIVMAAVLVIGPMVVLVAPRLVASLDVVRERAKMRGKKNETINDIRQGRKQ